MSSPLRSTPPRPRRPLDLPARAAISRYLTGHRPDEQLAEIRAPAQDPPPGALVRTFSLEDILLSTSAGAGKADPGGLLPR
ncbi:hypothetical protein [Amycolatopsis thermophila]|uniref:Uncharacterized protein n=1 Tax=Amycolatopsis thermophila TaxID=206084 RepID=A0ABU0F0E1_9PSEU|nr:hypothetical protein [Amycolatopsis thermophila]MDQ0381034.1 hypothetical protein [Amycolatopsis thermophila]